MTGTGQPAPGDESRGLERYRTFIDQSTEGIWCCEMAEPVPVDLPADEQIARFFETSYLSDCNLVMARMYGYSSCEELRGTRLATLLSPDDPGNIAYLRAFIQGGYRLADAESHEVDRHGRRKVFLNNLTGVVEGGRLLRAWGTQRDVTERRVLEEQLRQSQKMEAVGRLAGGIAHDFNNLLTAILGYAELLTRDVPPAGRARRRVEEIQRAAERAADLTRQLLAFSRRQVLVPAVLDVGALVRGVEDMLRRLISEEVALRILVDPDVSPVRADRARLEQVIVNLAVNARDAMPQGGELTIEVQDAELGPTAQAPEDSPVVAGPYVMLAVSDTGEGMDAATRERIFEPFFTTKEENRGTGLGLATVYGTIKQSGGYVWVYSEPGHGTTFKVYLPRAEGRPQAAAPAAPGPAGGRETVLLVEDEPAVREVAHEVLLSLGYTVLVAGSAAEAEVLLARRDAPADLVVTDVVMPGLSGRELYERLARRWPGLRVIYVSGYTDDVILRRGVVEKGTPFLQKPFTVQAFAALVRKVLDEPRPPA
jgi:two-component system, cell cycle sensor histidine kinase and response regulator CckA